MKAGTRVRCIDAKENGIPITEGEIYTVKLYRERMSEHTEAQTGDGPIKERADEPGVTLNEVGGYFMAKRFEIV